MNDEWNGERIRQLAERWERFERSIDERFTRHEKIDDDRYATAMRALAEMAVEQAREMTKNAMWRNGLAIFVGAIVTILASALMYRLILPGHP